jgi:hypothetical protein
MFDIRLNPSDPTVFAECPKCKSPGHRNGKRFEHYFGKAYTVSQWRRTPVCDNCETPMVAIYSIDTEDVA